MRRKEKCGACCHVHDIEKLCSLKEGIGKYLNDYSHCTAQSLVGLLLVLLPLIDKSVTEESVDARKNICYVELSENVIKILENLGMSMRAKEKDQPL